MSCQERARVVLVPVHVCMCGGGKGSYGGGRRGRGCGREAAGQHPGSHAIPRADSTGLQLRQSVLPECLPASLTRVERVGVDAVEHIPVGLLAALQGRTKPRRRGGGEGGRSGRPPRAAPGLARAVAGGGDPFSAGVPASQPAATQHNGSQPDRRALARLAPSAAPQHAQHAKQVQRDRRRTWWVSTSLTVSASPPVDRTTGTVPYRSAIICTWGGGGSRARRVYVWQCTSSPLQPLGPTPHSRVPPRHHHHTHTPA